MKRSALWISLHGHIAQNYWSVSNFQKKKTSYVCHLTVNSTKTKLFRVSAYVKLLQTDGQKDWVGWGGGSDLRGTIVIIIIIIIIIVVTGEET